MFQCNAPGPNVLQPGDTVTWKFRDDFFSDNNYNCWFAWFPKGASGLKQASFSVFDVPIRNLCGTNLFKMNRCYWSITQKGFYFYYDNEASSDDNGSLMHSWN